MTASAYRTALSVKCSIEDCNNNAVGYVHSWPKDTKSGRFPITITRFCEGHKEWAYEKAGYKVEDK